MAYPIPTQAILSVPRQNVAELSCQGSNWCALHRMSSTMRFMIDGQNQCDENVPLFVFRFLGGFGRIYFSS